MLHIHLVRMHHSWGPRHPAQEQQDRATKSGNQQLWHVTHIWDQSLRAQQYVIPRRCHSQVTIRFMARPCTACTLLQSSLQTAGTGRRRQGLVRSSRNRILGQALKIRYSNPMNYLMFMIQYTKWWGYGSCDGNVTAAPTKPITLPWQRGFSGGGKKEE